MADLETIDRQFLVERQLISREHANSDGARAVAIDNNERLSLMVNEEDHLRIQLMKSGLDLVDCLGTNKRSRRYDRRTRDFCVSSATRLFDRLSDQRGNRHASQRLVHLPALVITQQIDKVFRSLQRINLVVRGLYGEGTQAMGDFFQVSNQITLGKDEQELMKQVGDVVPVLINYERKARDFLITENQHDLFDQVSRAFGRCRTRSKLPAKKPWNICPKFAWESISA